MKIKHLFILLLIIWSHIGYSQWKQFKVYFGEKITSLLISNNEIYVSSNPGGIFCSKDKGNNWDDLSQSLVSKDINSIAVIGDKIFAVSDSNGIFASVNKGKTWNKIADYIDVVRIIGIDNKLYIAQKYKKEIYVSEDFGKTWKVFFTYNFKILDFYCLIKNNDIYLTINGALYKSHDNGLNWQELKILKNLVLNIKEKGNDIFIATKTTFYKVADTNVTIFNEGFGNNDNLIESFDVKEDFLICSTVNNAFVYNYNEQNWIGDVQKIKNINRIVIQDDIIYAGTTGGSVWYRSKDELYTLSHNTTYTNIDINNVSARINANGNLFWDFMGNNHYEVPKGSNKSTVFLSSLWVGGKDQNGILHLAGERHRQVGEDFYSGPISNTAFYYKNYAKWNNIWKINKKEIDDFIQNWTKPSYNIPNVIKTWPGNGDKTAGQAPNLAPFYDNDNDGIYNPEKGDYPLIKGDQALFFIINDENKHTESGGLPLGIEVHVMVYAFDMPADSALKNTIFINYKIFNRSAIKYDSLYIGLFTDFDIGFAFDDFVGCDVALNSYYCYNGDIIDGTYKPNEYGEHPPAQGVTFLNNEMSNFMYFNNTGGVMGDPLIALSFYKYMQSIWKDGSHLIYGGNGHKSSGAYGPDCNYMFPGDSDPSNKGTKGIEPYGPKIWDEISSNNVPYDRRGLGSVGPMTFEPGDSKCMEIAYVYARDYTGDNLSSIKLLKKHIATVRDFYVKNVPGSCSDSPDNYTISGKLSYKNKYNTPIKNTNIYLKNCENNKIVKETITDIEGNYIFTEVKNGNYFIEASILKKWAGADPLDALIVNRHFLGNYNFTDLLCEKAADMNGDKIINPIDALIIIKFYLGKLSKFNVPYWITEKPIVIINNNNASVNIKTICVGDVNGSDIPGW